MGRELSRIDRAGMTRPLAPHPSGPTYRADQLLVVDDARVLRDVFERQERQPAPRDTHYACERTGSVQLHH